MALLHVAKAYCHCVPALDVKCGLVILSPLNLFANIASLDADERSLVVR